jgi:WD40 repeat protein
MASLSNTSIQDVELANGPHDSISALAFSSITNLVAVASWDSKVSVYDLTQSPNGQGKALINFDLPVLDCHWSRVISLVFLRFTLMRTLMAEKFPVRMAKTLLALAQITMPVC